jgi:hypothetical protein
MSKHHHQPPSSSDESAAERRIFRRIATRIEGRVVFAGVDTDCIVHEMSATGALVECLPLPAHDAKVALDVPGVGFALGRVMRLDGHLACVALDAAPEKRDRLADRLILAAFHNPPDA